MGYNGALLFALSVHCYIRSNYSSLHDEYCMCPNDINSKFYYYLITHSL